MFAPITPGEVGEGVTLGCGVKVEASDGPKFEHVAQAILAHYTSQGQGADTLPVSKQLVQL